MDVCFQMVSIQHAISYLDYIQSRLLNVDNQWASHIPYLLWSCNLLEQLKLHDAVSIAMHIRSSSLGNRNRQEQQNTCSLNKIVMRLCVVKQLIVATCQACHV